MNDVQNQARGAGIFCSHYAPGDGVTRYRFTTEDVDYFAASHPLATVLGRKQALVWLAGYKSGRNGS